MCKYCLNTGYVVVERFLSTAHSKKLNREVDQYTDSIASCRCNLGKFENKFDDNIFRTHVQLPRTNKFILAEIDLDKAAPNYYSLRMIG